MIYGIEKNVKICKLICYVVLYRLQMDFIYATVILFFGHRIGAVKHV